VNGVTIGTTTPLYFKTSSGWGLLQFSLLREFTANGEQRLNCLRADRFLQKD
jgi:hypothetical protein